MLYAAMKHSAKVVTTCLCLDKHWIYRVPSLLVDEASATSTTTFLMVSFSFNSSLIESLKVPEVKRNLMVVLVWHSQLWSLSCCSKWGGAVSFIVHGDHFNVFKWSLLHQCSGVSEVGLAYMNHDGWCHPLLASNIRDFEEKWNFNGDLSIVSENIGDCIWIGKVAVKIVFKVLM